MKKNMNKEMLGKTVDREVADTATMIANSYLCGMNDGLKMSKVTNWEFAKTYITSMAVTTLACIVVDQVLGKYYEHKQKKELDDMMNEFRK